MLCLAAANVQLQQTGEFASKTIRLKMDAMQEGSRRIERLTDGTSHNASPTAACHSLNSTALELKLALLPNLMRKHPPNYPPTRLTHPSRPGTRGGGGGTSSVSGQRSNSKEGWGVWSACELPELTPGRGLAWVGVHHTAAALSAPAWHKEEWGLQPCPQLLECLFRIENAFSRR